MSKEIENIFFSDANYNVNNYYSEWVNMAQLQYIRFTSFCNQVHDKGIEWAIDTNYNVIEDDTTAGLNNYDYREYPVKGRYGRLYIRNIAALPCNIELQAFYNK